MHERFYTKESIRIGPIQKTHEKGRKVDMSTNTKTMRLLLWHAWQYKIYVFGLLCTLPLVLLVHQILPPIIAADILNRLSTGDFVAGRAWESFSRDIIIYALLLLLGGTLMWRFFIFLVWKMEINVQRDIAERMFNHLSTLDMEFHNNSFGGSLVSRTNKLMNSYVRLADTFLFEIYGLLISAVAMGIVLWPLVPRFVIAFYIFAVIYIFIAVRITRRIRVLSSIEAEKQNKVTGYLADMITNVMAVKSFSAQSYENKRFSLATGAVKKASTRLMWSQLHRENIFALSTTTISVLALTLAVFSVVDFGAEIGTVFLVLTYTANMTTRLWDFSQRSLRNINKSLGDAEEATEILYRNAEVTDPQKPQLMPTNGGVIDFVDVQFSHDKNKLFQNFSLSIKQGEKIGLVGHSGSGKTTLTKLLLRFKDIDDGYIKINGVDIRDVTQVDLRRVISYVPQEPLLFHRSLEENIAYGKEHASQNEIIKAAKNAHAHEFIQTLDDGYKTLVGERGVKLSGGQKQRVAIARAMLKDAPVLLLDEATSALDSESEQLIQDALWKLMEDKTAIVIAHRLSTIQKMDRIIVLDSGKIVEDGSHTELIKKKNGQYARLWQHQSGGFLQD